MQNLALIIFSFLFMSFKPVTRFEFVPNPEKPMRGKCYEIDNETDGKKLLVKVSVEKCRPKGKNTTTYFWLQNPGKPDGKCREIDRKTQGRKFAKHVGREKCIPKKIDYRLIEITPGSKTCFIVDRESGGASFLARTEKKNCKTDDVIYFFKSRGPKRGGICYGLDRETGGQRYKAREKLERCLPEETVLKWEQSESGKGQCFEIDKYKGYAGFHRKVFKDKCLGESKREYVFKLESPPLGKCYEMGRSGDGSSFLNGTDIENCRTDKTKIIFQKISSAKGFCLEIDYWTEGKKFTKQLKTYQCKGALGISTVKIWIDKVPGVRPGCYEVDNKTRGEEYIDRVKTEFCKDEQKLGVTWKPNPDGWGGRCVSAYIDVDGNPRVKSLRPFNCRPSVVKNIWHNYREMEGDCFEIDPRGSEYFSVKTDIKKCPVKEKIYLFHKRKEETSGFCYQVDKKTKGELFNKKVNSKKCKQLLFGEEHL